MIDAPKILPNNVYGCFTRVEQCVYFLTDYGRATLLQLKVHLSV